jgi:hypothetical protein
VSNNLDELPTSNFIETMSEAQIENAQYSAHQLLLSVLSSVLLSIPLGFCVGVTMVRKYGRFASNRAPLDDEHEHMCGPIPGAPLSLATHQYTKAQSGHLSQSLTQSQTASIPPPLPAGHPSHPPSVHSLTMSRMLSLSHSRPSDVYGHVLGSTGSHISHGYDSYVPSNPHLLITGQHSKSISLKPPLDSSPRDLDLKQSNTLTNSTNISKVKKIYL